MAQRHRCILEDEKQIRTMSDDVLLVICSFLDIDSICTCKALNVFFYHRFERFDSESMVEHWGVNRAKLNLNPVVVAMANVDVDLDNYNLHHVLVPRTGCSIINRLDDDLARLRLDYMGARFCESTVLVPMESGGYRNELSILIDELYGENIGVLVYTDILFTGLVPKTVISARKMGVYCLLLNMRNRERRYDQCPGQSGCYYRRFIVSQVVTIYTCVSKRFAEYPSLPCGMISENVLLDRIWAEINKNLDKLRLGGLQQNDRRGEKCDILLIPVMMYRQNAGDNRQPVWTVVVVEHMCFDPCEQRRKLRASVRDDRWVVRIGIISSGIPCCQQRCSDDYRSNLLQQLAKRFEKKHVGPIVVCNDTGIDMSYRYFKFMRSGKWPKSDIDETSTANDDLLHNLRTIAGIFRDCWLWTGCCGDGLLMIFILDCLTYNRVPRVVPPSVGLPIGFMPVNPQQLEEKKALQLLRPVVPVWSYAKSLVMSTKMRVVFGILDGRALTPPHVPPHVLSNEKLKVWDCVINKLANR
jgi:hypothetical protein